VALTPLTRVQQATVLALVEARRLDVVPADVARATSFLRQAEERLSQLPLLSSVVVRYGIAYDACHDTGEALLAAYGFRTTNGPGQHEALGRYLRAVLDKPPADRAAREFDRLRRARNQDRYEAKPVGAAATEKAEQVARTLVRRRPRQRALAVTQRSANSPQEVRPRPTIADDAQRFRQRVCAGQSMFSGNSRRWPMAPKTRLIVPLQRLIRRTVGSRRRHLETSGPRWSSGERQRSGVETFLRLRVVIG